MVLQLQDTTDTVHSLLSLTETLDTNGSITKGNLKWVLSDGEQDILVFELVKIPDLNLKTPFGSKASTKIQITGGLYVDQVLLVKPENINVLGGQVSVLYGDTMENELYRRYKERLQRSSNIMNDFPLKNTFTPTSINMTVNRASVKVDQSYKQQSNMDNRVRRMDTNELDDWPADNIEFDNEFDDWPMDDLDFDNNWFVEDSDSNNEFDDWSIDLDCLDQHEAALASTTAISMTPPQTTASTLRARCGTNTTPQPLLKRIESIDLNMGSDEEGDDRWFISTGQTTPSILLSEKAQPTDDIDESKSPRTSSTLPLVTTTIKMPRSGSPDNTGASSHQPPTVLDLEHIYRPFAPALPLATSNDLTTPVDKDGTSVLKYEHYDLDDLIMNDELWIYELSQMDDTQSDIRLPTTPKLISIPELRAILQSVDDPTFSPTWNEVAVQISGCRIRSMKTVPKIGLSLVVELVEHPKQEDVILVTFIYTGINDRFEGYTLEELIRMKIKQGTHIVKKKIFVPLRRTLLNSNAELVIDLKDTEKDAKYGLTRKCLKYTPRTPLD